MACRAYCPSPPGTNPPLRYGIHVCALGVAVAGGVTVGVGWPWTDCLQAKGVKVLSRGCSTAVVVRAKLQPYGFAQVGREVKRFFLPRPLVVKPLVQVVNLVARLFDQQPILQIACRRLEGRLELLKRGSVCDFYSGVARLAALLRCRATLTADCAHRWNRSVTVPVVGSVTSWLKSLYERTLVMGSVIPVRIDQ